MLEDFLRKLYSFLSNHQIEELGPNEENPGIPELGTDALKSLCSKIIEERARRVSLVVTDKTRPTPLKPIVNPMVKFLEEKNVKVEIVFATGTHEMTLEEASDMLGGRPGNAGIHVHDCIKDEHDHLGETPGGVSVEVLDKTLSADAAVLIGTVMPHPWAGFSGGSKLLLPASPAGAL